LIYAGLRQADNEFYGQVGHGNTDHASWGRPQDLGGMWRPSYKIDTSNPGSDLAGEAAAALAAASIAFTDTNSSLASGYLKHAKQLYEFASTYTGCLGWPAKPLRNPLLPPHQATVLALHVHYPTGYYSSSITDAGSFYPSTSYTDELAWAAAWLYRATGDGDYLTEAEAYWSNNGLGYKYEFSWDSKGQSHESKTLAA